MNKLITAGLAGMLVLLAGCATESSRTLEVAKVNTASSQYNGPRLSLIHI